MRAWRVAAALTLLALAAARRSDPDFEFDDDSEGRSRSSDPRRYIYDPHNPLCSTLSCGTREVCVLREGRALCADKRDILRRGDTLVASGARDDDEDVFYDEPDPEPVHDKLEQASTDDLDVPDAGNENRVDRCVGCGGAARGAFLCGSDNRTYSSLCRLDLHNCVRRPAAPVTMACRGFCPCPASRHKQDRALKPGKHLYDDYDEDLDKSRNEVWPHPRRGSRRRGSKQSKDPAAGCALDRLADRLLDWFSVLMDDAHDTPPPRQGFPRDCKPEVRWMFNHLDTDGDGLLSPHNLYALRHDEREQCLRPFLSGCARGAALPRAAWCACLRRAARPCTALARAHPQPHAGAYVPACDSRGFYRPRQCHPALGVCWCVTPHGQERPGSRTKGAPACPGEKNSRSHTSAEAGGAPADDEDADGENDAGSGAGAPDPELRF
ncbi:proteoglycan Cow [Pectinophora gossypiella]|uniref:proteoglycan Cow n=1 Tax=Pectinophora gossypiella TaxID=13191 RepID=UPI00214E9C10|nr:proteoglycan Cow [Pectinophora gossypiella]